MLLYRKKSPLKINETVYSERLYLNISVNYAHSVNLVHLLSSLGELRSLSELSLLYEKNTGLINMMTFQKILFEKPDLEYLTQNYVVADLHFHSHYSDGLNSIEKIAKRARKLNIGIAITDHNEIKGAIKIDRYKDLLTIPGIEVTSREGSHLLVYFYDIDSLKEFYHSEIKPFMGSSVMSSLSIPMEEVLQRATAYPAVTIFPHPYCAMYTGICNAQFSDERLENLYQLINGVEVINSGNLNKWNLKCTVLGFNLNKCITGGSDGHSIKHMGKAVTVASCLPSREAFLNAIIKKEVRVVGKEIDFFRKFTSNSLKLKTSIANYPDLLEKNLRYGRLVINAKSKKIKDNFRRKKVRKQKGDSGKSSLWF